LSGYALLDRLVRPLERAVDGDRRHLERLGGLPGREAEDVSEHEDGSLPGGQVLEGGREGELDALTLFVARVRAEHRSVDSELGVGVGLEPNRLGERLAESYVGIGRWTVVDREHALGPLLDQAEAGVGGNPIQPGAKRASTLEAGESAPGAEHSLLQRVLGVVH
jgi:hypothetical protein